MTLRQSVRRTPALATARLLRLNALARTEAHQSLGHLVRTSAKRWQDALAASRSGPRVLIATNSGGHFGISAIDRILALALTLRGAAVTQILCDGGAPACFLSEMNLLPDVGRFAARGPSRLLCGLCWGPAAARSRELGLGIETRSDNLTPDDVAEAERLADTVPVEAIPTFRWRNLAVGEHASAGALRYFAKGSLDGEGTDGERVLRRYLKAAVLTVLEMQRIIDRLRPAVIVAHHGIYEPQGIVAEVARSAGVRLVTWNPAYRRQTFIFSHADTYHHTLLTEPVDRWATTPLATSESTRVLEYLASRRRGTEDWIKFHQVTESQSPIREALSMIGNRPIIAAFTNVFWDAQLHYPANAFKNQSEWLRDSIEWASSRPDIALVIRVHPAELTGSPPSRQPAVEEIARHFPVLPANVAVVPPESDLSSYALAEAADTVLVYGTKMAVELSAVGIPVIVAGEAWVRNKGITQDAASPEDYRSMLDELPAGSRLPDAVRQRALAYAHHFFFRRMIPLGFIRSHPGPRRFTAELAGLEDLDVGADPGLDVICRGILQGTPFEMR